MRDTPHRDLAAAEARVDQANARIKELETHNAALHANAGKLRNALVKVSGNGEGTCWCFSRVYPSGAEYHDDHHDSGCIAARAVLAESEGK